jgi:hypothetical protein
MFSLNSDIPQIYTIVENDKKIAFNSMPFNSESFNITLGMYLPADGIYSINVSGIESFATMPGIILKDTKLNTTQDLTVNQSYEFAASITDDPNRFILSFNEVTLNTDKPNRSQLRVYSTPGKILVNGASDKSDVIVRNMMGQVVLRGSVNGESLYSVNASKLPVGVYVVSVVSGKQMVSEKIVVK